MPRIACRRVACFFAFAALTSTAFAGGYDANWSGKVTSLNAYSYFDQIFFSLDTMPSVPSGTCSNTSFAISAGDSSGSDAESRNRMYATLLAAFLAGQTVSVDTTTPVPVAQTVLSQRTEWAFRDGSGWGSSPVSR